MQTWNFKLATAQDVDIFDTIVGYVRYYERTAGGGTDARIRIKSLGGGVSCELTPGEAYRLAVPVRGLVVENMSGVALEGKLAIAPDASALDVGRLSGVVEVVDGEKSRTLAGGMFSAGAYAGPSPAVYSAAQLWNPLGSGKNLVVTGLSAQGIIQWSAVVYQSTAALANDTTATDAANKLSGAAMGVGLIKVQSIAFPAFASTKLHTMSGAAFVEREWDIRGALVVPPGRGLTILHQYSNADLNANFEWFEEGQT